MGSAAALTVAPRPPARPVGLGPAPAARGRPLGCPPSSGRHRGSSQPARADPRRSPPHRRISDRSDADPPVPDRRDPPPRHSGRGRSGPGRRSPDQPVAGDLAPGSRSGAAPTPREAPRPRGGRLDGGRPTVPGWHRAALAPAGSAAALSRAGAAPRTAAGSAGAPDRSGLPVAVAVAHPRRRRCRDETPRRAGPPRRARPCRRTRPPPWAAPAGRGPRGTAGRSGQGRGGWSPAGRSWGRGQWSPAGRPAPRPELAGPRHREVAVTATLHHPGAPPEKASARNSLIRPAGPRPNAVHPGGSPRRRPVPGAAARTGQSGWPAHPPAETSATRRSQACPRPPARPANGCSSTPRQRMARSRSPGRVAAPPCHRRSDRPQASEAPRAHRNQTNRIPAHPDLAYSAQAHPAQAHPVQAHSTRAKRNPARPGPAHSTRAHSNQAKPERRR